MLRHPPLMSEGDLKLSSDRLGRILYWSESSLADAEGPLCREGPFQQPHFSVAEFQMPPSGGGGMSSSSSPFPVRAGGTAFGEAPPLPDPVLEPEDPPWPPCATPPPRVPPHPHRNTLEARLAHCTARVEEDRNGRRAHLADGHAADAGVQEARGRVGTHLADKGELFPPADAVLLDFLPVETTKGGTLMSPSRTSGRPDLFWADAVSTREAVGRPGVPHHTTQLGVSHRKPGQASAPRHLQAREQRREALPPPTQ